MCEKNAAAADCNIRSGLGAILTRPGIHRLEKCLVRTEHVRVGDSFLLLKRSESIIDAGCKGGMLKPLHDRGILLTRQIS
jgi:hypothetical protein